MLVAPAQPEPVRGTLESLKAFQKQVDCDSSARGSHLDTAEKQKGAQEEDSLMNTGVMVVGMGMKAAELHRKSSANDDNDEPYIICPRCNGKGVRGKKNKICKTSNGTGKIPLSRF